jgi:putative membrane protein
VHDHVAHAHPWTPGFALLALTVVAAMLVVYLLAVSRQRHRGQRWSGWRVAFYTAGIGLLAVAFLPPVAVWVHHDLAGHMIVHLLIGMLAPLGLVLGAPVTLALRTVPVGVARRLTGLLRTVTARVLVHPVTALFLNVGGMYLLYLTPLYGLAQDSLALHALVHFHFLAAGYLFCWAILAGPDPTPDPPRFAARLAVLFVAMATHSTLGKLMYAYSLPADAGYTRDQIEFAAQVMYYGGDVAEVLLAVALFVVWYRSDGRRYRFLHPTETR